MNTIQGKRLLILGGSIWKETIKEFAIKNGITLIATGNDTSAGIFEIADEYYNVDSTNKAAMKNFIIDKKIDGVYMGGSEPVISVASEYINELGMHCYCTKKQWDTLENKGNFKDLCLKFGLPVVHRYNYSKKQIETGDIEIKYPVITKPADGSGSCGFSVCNNYDELKKGYIEAEKVSFSDSVLIEDFVPNNSIVVIGRVSNGNFKICTVEDKYTVRYDKQGSYVAGLHLFESRKKSDFCDLYEKRIEEMLKHIGIKEVPVWFEVFVNGNEYCFNELGFRYSGSVTIWPVQYFSKINEVATDIYYALTGESILDSFYSIISNSERKKKYCIYPLHIKPGTITHVSGIEHLRKDKDFIAIPITKKIGQTVEDTGTVAQVFAFVHFLYDTRQELEEKISYIHEVIRITDKNGNEMLNKMMNLRKVR